MDETARVPGRSEVIDGFRGIAVLSVMGYHYLLEWAPASGVRTGGLAWLALGKLGVELFFIISGLVIAMTVLRVDSAREFAVRRLARLYPAFLFSATIVFVALSFVDPLRLRVGFGDYLANWTMLAGDLGFRYVDGIFWTLAVEVKFYALVALSLLVLRRRFWLGIAAIGLAGGALYPWLPRIADHLLIARYMPLFLFGMAGWYAVAERQARPALILGAIAAGLYLLRADSLVPSPPLAFASHLLILGLGSLMLLLMALRPSLRIGPLAFVGRLSYSLYLIHQYLGVTAIHMLVQAGAPTGAAIAAVTLMTIGLASLMRRYIEDPGQRIVVAGLSPRPRILPLSGDDAKSPGGAGEPLPFAPVPAKGSAG